MTSQLGEKKNIVIHILTNISKSQHNQEMNFGQLIVYNMRNILLQKSYTKWENYSWIYNIPRFIIYLYIIINIKIKHVSGSLV